MDKNQAIRNLRMGIAASAVVAFGAGQQAQAQTSEMSSNKIPTKEYHTSGKAQAVSYEKSDFFKGLDNKQISQVLQLTYSSDKELYYLSGDYATSMQEEYNINKKLRKDARESRKLHRKNGKKVLFNDFVVKKPQTFTEYGSFDSYSKEITLNKISYSFTPASEEEKKAYDKKLEITNTSIWQDNTLVHEEKHRENNRKNEPYGVGFEQTVKLETHDEISANVAQLIHSRDLYIDAKTKNPQAKIEDYFVYENLKFYVDAVNSGKVNPMATDKESREKDYSLMINGTQKMWEENLAVAYNSNIKNKVDSWRLSGASSVTQPDEKKYEEERDKFYNFEIDGKKVNLSQYRQKDVTLVPSMKEYVDEQQASKSAIDKNFVDFAKKNIKTEDDLKKVQEKAKSILELRGLNNKDSKSTNNQDKSNSKVNTTFVANPNMFNNSDER